MQRPKRQPCSARAIRTPFCCSVGTQRRSQSGIRRRCWNIERAGSRCRHRDLATKVSRMLRERPTPGFEDGGSSGLPRRGRGTGYGRKSGVADPRGTPERRGGRVHVVDYPSRDISGFTEWRFPMARGAYLLHRCRRGRGEPDPIEYERAQAFTSLREVAAEGGPDERGRDVPTLRCPWEQAFLRRRHFTQSGSIHLQIAENPSLCEARRAMTVLQVGNVRCRWALLSRPGSLAGPSRTLPS